MTSFNHETPSQEELEKSNRWFKSATPKYTFDWYVKWISMLFAVAGIFLISASFVLYGQVAYMISTIGWIYVGMQWSDRAIMIGSAISGTAVAMNIVNSFIV